jgi:5,10-methylenetetrahydrofolate reductase
MALHGGWRSQVVEGGLACALDLVHFIKKAHGDHFGLGVAGYPEAHPDTIVEDPEQMDKNYWANLDYLKKKVIRSHAASRPTAWWRWSSV